MMSHVVDVVLSPSSSLEGYRSVGSVGNGQHLLLKTCSFNDDSNPCIVDMDVLDDPSSLPHGWEHVGYGISIKRSKHVSSSNPIIDIQILTSGMPLSHGFFMVERPVQSPNNESFYLSYLREDCSIIDPENEIKLIDEEDKVDDAYQIGELIDCQDTSSRWCIAKILDRRASSIYVHYQGWNDKWNEWICIDSGRLAPLYTFTSIYMNTTTSRNNVLTGQFVSSFQKDCEMIKQLYDIESSIQYMDQNGYRNVQTLLSSSSPYNLDECIILEYIHNVITVCLRILSQGKYTRSILDTLIHIFNSDQNLYKYYRNGSLTSIVVEETYSIKSEHAYASSYWIDNINIFGRNNGFPIIKELIYNCIENIKDLRTLVHLIKCMSLHLIEDFTLSFLPGFQEIVLNKILYIIDTGQDEIIKNMNDDLLNNIVHDLLLLSTSKHESELIHIFRLDVFCRYLKSTFLSKRIYGLMQILDIVELVSDDHFTNSSFSYSGRRRIDLSSPILLRWIVENELVAVLVGSGLHHEILGRSLPLFRYLAQTSSIQESDILSLWNICLQGNHESMIRIVYSIIIELIPYLSELLLEFVYNQLIKCIHHSQISDYIFTFIHEFCTKSMDSNGKLYGIDLYWDMVQDDSEMAISVQSKAYSALIQLLSMNGHAVQNERIFIIKQCINNLNVSKSIPQSLRLGKDVIELFPEHSTHSNIITRDSLIMNLNQELDIIDKILKDLILYTNEARRVISSTSQEEDQGRDVGSSKDSAIVCLTGTHSHLEEFGYRLSFLQYILSHSHLFLEQEHFVNLWDMFIERPVFQSDSSLFLKWLFAIRANTNDEYGCDISDELTLTIFESYLSDPTKLDPVLLDIDGYECFELFFKYINAKNQSIQHPYRQRSMIVKSFQGLVGIDYLWNVSTECNDKQVRTSSRELLVNLFIRVKHSHGEDLNVYLKIFIHECMVLLSNYAGINDKMERVLGLLHLFLTRCHEEQGGEGESLIPYPHHLLSTEYFIHLLSLSTNSNSQVTSSLWSIIKMLPINPQMKELIDCPSKETWNQVLDFKSIIKLMYSLQIIDSNIKSDSVSLSTYLFDASGLDYILHECTKTNSNDFFQNHISLHCLLMLLNMISSCLSGLLKAQAFYIFNQFDSLDEFVRFLWNCIDGISLLNHGIKEHESDRIECVELCFSILRSLLGYRYDLLQTSCEFSNLQEILFCGIVQSDNKLFSKCIADNLSSFIVFCDGICMKHSIELKPSAIVFPILLKYLPSTDQKCSTCPEYFSLCESIAEHCPLSAESESISTLSLRIKTHPFIEMNSKSTPDQLLIGLISLLTIIVENNSSTKYELGMKHGLIEEVFTNCLFSLPKDSCSPPPPKCKTERSRRTAFLFLYELVTDCSENILHLLKLLEPWCSLSTHSESWDVRPTYLDKSETGLVGMKNLGCICYMNALIQQLFMIPSLRNEILNISDSNPEKDESFLYQLQYILGFLQISQKQYCDPSKFCSSFKEWDGSPTDVTVQKDTNEFLNMLFDRIDTQTKGTVHEKALSSHLGGVFTNELVCRDCPHFSERDEEFYCMTLNVKNKKNVHESLEDFVEGELLAGENAYYCSKCDKKIDTVKRVVIKELPSTLIIHLKRFELNYDTMQMAKLNDRYEFPEYLDMKPYTKEGLALQGKGIHDLKRGLSSFEDTCNGGQPEADKETCKTLDDNYYQYRLSGVLIHTGSAYGGHYYSFIKDRDSLEKWYLFNDSTVTEFDPKDIPDECFGGEEVHYRSHYSSSFESDSTALYKTERRRNAYLLFYDRVPKMSNGVGAQITPRIPQDIFDSLWQENLSFWRDKLIFDYHFSSFLETIFEKCVLNSLENEQVVLSSCKISFLFIANILSKSHHKDSIMKWFQLLEHIFSSSPAGCNWLLSYLMGNINIIDELLAECPSSSIRQAFASLLSVVITTVIDNQSGGAQEVVSSFISVIIGLLKNTPVNWKRYSGYLKLLSAYSCTGVKGCQNLFSAGVGEYLMDLLLNPHSTSRWNATTPNYEDLLCIIRELSVVCDSEQTAGFVERMKSSDFLEKLISETCSSPNLSTICVELLCMLCDSEWDTSVLTIDLLCSCIQELDEDDEIECIFTLFAGLLEMEDRYSSRRMDLLLSSLIDSISSQNLFWNSTSFCIGRLLNMAMYDQAAFEWIKDSLSNNSSFSWISEWLQEHKSPPSNGYHAVRLSKPGRSRGSYYDGSNNIWPANISFTNDSKLECLNALIAHDFEEFTQLYMAPSDSEDVYEVGLRVDCLNRFDKWCKGEIMQKSGDCVFIHFDGWNSQWDEWIPCSADRIARLGTMTGTDQVAGEMGELSELGEGLGYSSDEGAPGDIVEWGISH